MTTSVLRAAAIGLPVLALAVTTFATLRDPESALNRAIARYVETLRARFASLFVFVDPKPIVAGQALTMYVFGALALVERQPLLLWAIGAVAVLPGIVLSQLQAQRRRKIEEQTDVFVTALASALHSTPSIGDAFRSLGSVVAEPLRSEIDLASKHMRLGATFEQALGLMGLRIESREVDTALTSILLGQRVGGAVPTTLSATADALRELHRLHRTSRAQLSAARLQVWVIAFMPFVMVYVLERIMPGYFAPLRESIWGAPIAAVAIALWVSALVAARRILAVAI